VLQQRILDVIKGSVATAALFLAIFFLPYLGTIPSLFAPAPGIYYGLKSGRVVGFAVVLIMVLILSTLGDPAVIAIYLLQAGVMTLALTEFLSRRMGGARSVVYSVAVNLLVILAVIAVYGFATGGDLHTKVIKGVNTSILQTATVYQKMGITGDELKALQDSMRQAASLIVTVYPALVTVGLGMIAALNIGVVSRIGARFRVPVYLGDFRKYRNPEPMIWLLIIAGFALLVPENLVYLSALNITIVLCALYSVQGFAVLSHFFSRFSVPKYARIILSLLLILQPFLVLAVTVLGIFDLWGNFRSPHQQKNL